MISFNSSEYLLESSKQYAIYTCKKRAIPHVGDGLKVVQRMILWLLRNRADKMKTLSLTGLLGYEKLYVHGDKSANDAISLLAAPYKNNIPLVQGHGQFGSRKYPDEEGIGAPRYTEVQRAKSAELILYHDLDILPLEDNYDGSNKQPIFFLPLIPLVLLNGVSGIAVGYSTDIMPHKISDLIKATKSALQGKKITSLVPYFENYNITVSSTEKQNQWIFSGKVEILSQTKIRITELPPGISLEEFLKKLNKMEDLDQIQSYEDSSTDKIDVLIKMKRRKQDENGEYLDEEWTEERALNFFKLHEKTTERLVVLDWDNEHIRMYDTPEDLVQDFAGWRLGWYSVRYDKMISDTHYEICYWVALQTLFEKNFPSKLGSFENKKEMEQKVVRLLEDNPEEYAIDEDQLSKIVNLSTYMWTKEFKEKVDQTIEKLMNDYDDYRYTRSDPEKLKKIYISELDDLAKALKI